MDLIELLKRQRKVYIDFFQSEIKRSNGVGEVLLDLKNGQKEELFRLHRFDCLELNEDESFKTIEFNNDKIISHMLVEYQFKNLTIALEPFFWNGCEIYLNKPLPNLNALVKWGNKWMDVKSERVSDAMNKLNRVIHNIQPPEKINGETMIAIDFGTAEVKAVLELFELIEKAGVTYMRVNSIAMMA